MARDNHLPSPRYNDRMPGIEWHVPLSADYKRIENDDSIQYVSRDGTRTIYTSTLIVTDPANVRREPPRELTPALKVEGDKFHLKGTKVREGQVLVVVITFTRREDEPWARDLFDHIY
jgi:hypothetical protein